MLRPRCWSGRNSTRSPRSNAQRSARSALDDVHTAPPCAPVKPLMAAEEFMYVIGTVPSATPASSSTSHASRTCWICGHVGHRAAGREVRQDHRLVGRGQDVGGLGHEVDAAEHDVLGLRARGGVARQLERVAGDVGELDDLVALVVVAQDEGPLAQRGPRRAGALRRGSGRTRTGASPGQSTPRSLSASEPWPSSTSSEDGAGSVNVIGKRHAPRRTVPVITPFRRAV